MTVKLIALHIYKWESESPILLCSAMDLQKLWFYQRGTAKELINFSSRLIAGRI
jgi:synaptobrevin homolog YKT6